MLALTIVLFVSAIICYFVIWYTYKPQAEYKNGMLFAITLPADVIEHADIREIQDGFNKRLTKTSMWLLISLIPLLLLYVWPASQLLYFFVWCSALIVVMVLPFRWAFRQTLALKRKNEWFVGTNRVILTDLRVAHLKNQRSASLWLFTIPFAMAIGMMLWAGHQGKGFVGSTSLGFILTAILLFVSLMIRRTKAKVFSMNSEANVVLNQARRRAVSYLGLFIAVFENIRVVFIYLLLVNENAQMEGVWITIIVLFTVIPAWMIYYVYRNIRNLEHEVLANDGKAVYTDDDEYWGNGFTYHNPHDKSIFVTKRIGIGETVNTATWVGKLIIWGSFALIAVLILGSAFMLIRSEVTTPVLAITSDHKVDIEYPMYSFDFNLADVKQVTLVDSVPSYTKTAGENLNTFARGHFRLKGLGKARLYIFKSNPPYIQIKLDSGYIFYNEKDPEKTRQLFEQLQKQVSTGL